MGIGRIGDIGSAMDKEVLGVKSDSKLLDVAIDSTAKGLAKDIREVSLKLVLMLCEGEVGS